MVLSACIVAFALLGHTCASPPAVFNVHGPLPDLLPVPTNFVGFSIEVGGVLRMIGSSGENKAYAQVLRNLAELSAGPHAGPILRFGGNSADDSCFDGGASKPQCNYNITETDLGAYKKFATETAKDVNISYIIDTNFGLSSDPRVVATKHIKALSNAELWSLVKGVEIGNEMDIYAKHDQHRNKSYTFAEYMIEFGDYVRAFDDAGLPPGPSLQGATFASTSQDWGAGVAVYVEQWATRLGSLSLHSYSKSHCNAKSTTPEEMISEAACAGKARHFRSYAATAASHGVEFVIGEGNSASCGGVPGVSDTFASALWVVDWLSELSKIGAYGQNFHGGPSGVYPAIAFDSQGALEVRPLYYGLLAFSELVANASRWLNVSTAADTGDPACGRGLISENYCCAAECGTCGGNGCDNRPGGSSACCVGRIKQDNNSCTTQEAPCVLDPSYVPAAVAHATRDSSTGELRVLLISRGTEGSETRTCFPSAEVSAAASVGFVSRLEAPSLVAKLGDGIRWHGQTFDGSADGLPLGSRLEETVTAQVGSATCFDVILKPMSAAMLRVPAPSRVVLVI